MRHDFGGDVQLPCELAVRRAGGALARLSAMSSGLRVQVAESASAVGLALASEGVAVAELTAI